MARNKGQATIWIILAVLLVGVVILFLSLEREPEKQDVSGGEVSFDVVSFLETCIKPKIIETVDLMLPQGGFLNPKNSIFFNNINIEYVCKNIGYYEPCINQHPMLIKEVEEQIEEQTLEKVVSCLDRMKAELERRGGEVIFDSNAPKYNVELAPDRIFTDIEKKTTVSKDGETRSFDNFRIEIEHSAHNLLTIAGEIAAQEAKYCYFEYVGYSILYPKYEIRKYTMSEPTKIYTIKELNSGIEMNTAIRGCAIPAGF